MQDGSSYTFTPLQPLKTAVLLLVFNRLDTTKQVFEAIRLARPPRLYISADGPEILAPVNTRRSRLSATMLWAISTGIARSKRYFERKTWGVNTLLAAVSIGFSKMKKWELFWKMIACRILLFLGFARSYWSDTGRMSELGS